MSYITTSTNPTGNRLILDGCSNSTIREETGSLKPLSLIEQRNERISWILGSFDSSQFLLYEENGSVRRVSFEDDALNETLTTSHVSTRPPITMTETPLVPLPIPESASLYSSGVPVPDGGHLFVSNDQKQALFQRTTNDIGETVDQLVDSSIMDPLLDGSIVYSSANQLWGLYSHATNERYVHAVLGDNLEGYHLNVLKYENGSFTQTTDIALDGDSIVFEGLSPMWTDVDGDGIEDLLTTVATDGLGAALRVYFLNADGTIKEKVADSDFIGQGNRWLHQVASGPIDGFGGHEIVEIRTPHIGGKVRYYQLDNDAMKLRLTAEISGFTSHALGSRNLDQTLMYDFNNDGIPELVVQSQDKRRLHGLQRSLTGVDSVWSVSLDAPIQTNIASICGPFNTPELVFGTQRSSLVRVSFVTSSSSLSDSNPSGTSTAASLSSRNSTPWLLLATVLSFLLRR